MKGSKIFVGRVSPGEDPEVDDLICKMNTEKPSLALLTSLVDEKNGQRLAHLFGTKFRAYRALDDLSRYANELTLLSFSTSVIVPEDILGRFSGGAYNLHAASPEYPGRDPHHWAIYNNATQYGATLHVMTKLVDDGPIIDTEIFSVHSDETPYTLLNRANEAAYCLLERNAHKLLSGNRLTPVSAQNWTGKKHSRKDFLEMCRLDPDISGDEFNRRVRAFDGGTYDNLSVTIHGRTFRIEKAGKPYNRASNARNAEDPT